MASVAVGVVGAVVAAVVAFGLAASSSTAAPRVALTSDQQAHLTTVPLSVLVAASSMPAGSRLSPAFHLSGAPPYSAAGQPAILYIGAEYCPVCAAERWPMVVALSQFGTFTHLSQTRSGVHDGDLATLSFYGSSYSSPYFKFEPLELQTNVQRGNTYTSLETATPAQTNLWVSTLGRASYPFVDIGGSYVIDTYQYPGDLLDGKSFDAIANDVGDNSSSIGASIDSSAAALVKYICGITGQQPAATCQAVANVKAPVTEVAGHGQSSGSG